MDCHKFNQNISLYLDDVQGSELRGDYNEHLRRCPLCRVKLSELRAVTDQLNNLKKPVAPFDLAAALNRSIAIELAAQEILAQPQAKTFWWETAWTKYLQPQLIPVATGVLTSFLLFTLMFVSLIQSIATFRQMEVQSRRERAERETLLAEINRQPYEQLSSLPAADYAVRRLSITSESPSLNPQSAFVALTSSLTRGETKNGAIMVVADVLSDGFANIADVIQSPHESGKLAELDKLLREDPAFVPASLDHRPDNVRVVLLIQRVDVPENAPLIEMKIGKK